nr:uncharacterized protein CI109_002681 [Kwoniella shandongensis]KAA5528924.1 hypothetical protein CI109_002681 [Kwoniella shandongensis]
MSSPSVIPTIDLASDSPQRQAELIKHALGSVGFFAVINAGPKPEDVDAMFDHSKTFFDLPMEEKEVYLAGKSGSGYTKLLSQALGEGKRDHKETFSYGKYCANTTQPVPPPFKDDNVAHETIKRFYQDCHDVSERLMELFALALELPREHFRQSHSFGLNTAMSLIHYPALKPDEQKQLSEMDIRAGERRNVTNNYILASVLPSFVVYQSITTNVSYIYLFEFVPLRPTHPLTAEHKDWGTMTLLFQQSSGQPGLQVNLPRSAIDPSFSDSTDANSDVKEDTYDWYPAPIPPPGGFLVNVGLGMELWSSGMYRATLHRVIFPTPSSKEVESEEGLVDRYTLGFFVQPDDDVAFQPILPGGKIDTSVKAITSGELFDSKLRESMNRFKDMSARQNEGQDHAQVQTQGIVA